MKKMLMAAMLLGLSVAFGCTPEPTTTPSHSSATGASATKTTSTTVTDSAKTTTPDKPKDTK